MTRTEWIVVYDGSSGGKRPMTHACLRCGTEYTPALPMPVDLFVAMGRAFIRQHRACPLRLEGASRDA